MLTGETERLVTESKMSAGKVANYHMELMQKQRSEIELGDKIRRLESEIAQVSSNLLKLEENDCLKKFCIINRNDQPS